MNRDEKLVLLMRPTTRREIKQFLNSERERKKRKRKKEREKDRERERERKREMGGRTGRQTSFSPKYLGLRPVQQLEI